MKTIWLEQAGAPRSQVSIRAVRGTDDRVRLHQYAKQLCDVECVKVFRQRGGAAERWLEVA